ncbi:MAG: prepilin-type N-terminal cleavage/methylation domain-containing protein [Gemmatimonadetes bacterium]|nr:prepilin-type N-terminal cleavage/methylation domain-containing protein [Gemmatimonadota bacterium]
MVRSDHGFTLIEMLIVMVVVGILAAIAIPKLNVTRERSYLSAMKSDLKNLAAHQEMYYADTYTYGSDLNAIEMQASDGVTITINEATTSGWAATASHQGIAGEQCGIYYADASAANGSPATVAGRVACTR